MQLSHLRYFLVVAEEGHFSRAAERLAMQATPLRHHIRLLEKELGFDLFRRHPKGVELSVGGAAFKEEVKGILRNVELATAKAARAARGYAGNLSIGFTSSAAAHPLIPAIINAYRNAYPEVHLDLHEGNAAELTEHIAAGAVSLGFLRTPVSQPRGMRFHHLLDEEALLVLPVGHALLRQAQTSDMPVISLKALVNEQFILVRRHAAPGMYARLIEACEQAGFTPRIAREVERMLTNISLVAAGGGISVVPASMKNFHRDSVVYCRLRDAGPALVAPVTLVNRSGAMTMAEKNFVELARKTSSRHAKN